MLSFDSLIGQDKAKKLLKNAVTNHKISHAYLFKGPTGVGKKSLAKIFAAYINCSSPIAKTGPCNNCPSCRKFQTDNHPDFIIIEPDGVSIKISQVRELKHSLNFPPYEAAYRVVLLPDIQAMRREAANSLLKTLEEPPPNTILILCADEASNILPTINSRCQIIPFFPLPYEQVAQLLAQDGISPVEADTLAAISEGSIGRARLLASNELLSLRREIIENLLQTNLNNPESTEIVIALAEKSGKLKEDLSELLDLLKIWLRDLVVTVNARPDKTLSRDLASALQFAKNRWTLPEIYHRLEQIDRAKRQLNRNCNRGLICEVLFFALL
ncbi:MAG: DNA polymerase III subunit delta' [Proteobacteria bacterium]|nr:DNA polymerase III subunit delta' [Pseudomonadota bacterium]MBU1716417.1 DNA polymerase III subunit delta' [Pseudomonadota bacterium]